MKNEKHGSMGLLFDAPRVALPTASVVLQSGESGDLCFAPQRMMLCPYWLGVTEAASVVVERVQVGPIFLFYSWGDVPGQCFDASDPSGLVPMAGPALVPGSSLLVRVRNVSSRQVELAATIWGSGEGPAATIWGSGEGPAATILGSGEGPGFRAHAAVAGVERRLERVERWLLRLEADSMRESFLRDMAQKEQPAPDPDAERQRAARAADVDASREHVEKMGPFEPGDAWQSPAWEE